MSHVLRFEEDLCTQHIKPTDHTHDDTSKQGSDDQHMNYREH
jgi:hypothetical protein